MSADFVHLHTHSHYSFLDGAVTIDQYIEKAQEFEMPALAITDHGNVCGAIEFYSKAQGKIKPILGFEAYVVPDHTKKEDQKRNHLVLLAMNYDGYKNIIKLTSAGYRDGFYRKPTIDKTLLRKHNEGIICLSACIQGEVQQAILRNELDKAEEIAKEYAEIFEGRYYLELQNHYLREDVAVNENSAKIAKKLGLKTVATSDSHYLTEDDFIAHDALLCIGTGSLVTDPNRMRFPGNEFWFMPANVMKERFVEYPESIETSLEIAECCNVEFPGKQYLLPEFHDIPEGSNASEQLEVWTREGLKKLYGENLDGAPNNISKEQVEERLNHELRVINKMGFPDYFLITSDFIQWAKENGVSVGPGRGSAAGSLVSYALGITEVDPFRYDLIFERFLNEERISMPDIDIDFDPVNREKVYDYVTEKYGKNNVCHIITYGTLKARAVVKDVGRVLEIPLNEVNAITKLIPPIGAKIKEAVEQEDLKKLIEGNKAYQQLFDIAKRLENLNRHPGVHAAGVIIAPGDLDEYVPLFWTGKEVVTQYSMEYAEQIGLLKMDFLGLNNLIIITRALELIERNHGIKIDFRKIPLDDKKTFDILSRGEGLGLFQVESDGMRNLLRSMKPDRFEDIIALLALYRPGPLESGMVATYVDVKHKRREIPSLHEKIDDLLEETNGVILYQEQVMRIAQKMSNFSLAQADNLRKAMGKKKVELMEKFRKQFVEGAKSNGIEEKTSENIFQIMVGFAAYGFNKSHSTAYAFITYQTAYLKAHYPLDYMAALLTSKMGGSVDTLVKYMRDVKRQGINIVQPSVNISDSGFAVRFFDEKKEQGEIVYGLGGIKGVGEAAIDLIVSERDMNGTFNSVFDFVERLSKKVINKGTLETLIKAGALDEFDMPRERMLAGVENLAELAGSKRKNKKQKSFDFSATTKIEEDDEMANERFFPKMPEWTKIQKLAAEREVIGMYISDNPLSDYESILEKFCSHQMTDLDEIEDGSKVVFGGIINDFATRTIQKGKSAGQQMATFGLDGLVGRVQCVCFSEAYQALSDILVPDKPLMIIGRINERNEEKQIVVDDAFDILQSKSRLTSAVYLRIRHDQVLANPNLTEEVDEVFKNYRGKAEVFFEVSLPEGTVTLAANSTHKVNPTPAFENDIQNILGEKSLNYRVIH